MKQPRLVILTGKPISGKSTTFHNIRKLRALSKWIFIDHHEIEREVEDVEGTKQKFFFELGKAMGTGRNIITEDTTRGELMIYLGEAIEKLKYKVIIFQFEVSLEEAKRRNKHREKNWQHHLIEDEELESAYKKSEKEFDKHAILVNTDKLNKKQIVDFILRKIGE